MRHLLWTILSTSTLLTACDGPSEINIRTQSLADESGVLKVVDGLQCPQTEGVLTRKGSASADGRACAYAGPRGSEVELLLLDLNNERAEQVLKRLELQLNAGMGNVPEMSPTPPTPPEPPAAPSFPARNKDLNTEHSSVKLPGLQVEADGERSTVRLPGMKIESVGDRSEVRIGGIVIRSDGVGDKSQVRMTTDSAPNANMVEVDETSDTTRVRVQVPGDAIRAHYRLVVQKNDNLSWRAVGYDARGPAGGPIVVATVRSRADNNDRVFDAAKDLVTLNVGK